MLMKLGNQDIETLFPKKPAKKSLKAPKKAPVKVMKNIEKAAKKVAPKKAAKVVKAKKVKLNVKKDVAKKVSKPKKVKAKVYKVSGSFSLDAEGNVLKKTKSIDTVNAVISRTKKEALVTFLVKLK